MPFKRALSETFKHKVVVNIANEKGGYDQNDFIGIFQRTPSSELDELRTLKTDELVRRKLVGWQMTDADSKEPVPFSTDELETLMQITTVPLAIWVAFWDGVNGQKQKNF
ncbi:MAG TPA: hypothetical protein VGE70_06100 [Burkholderiaceae bacterium]